MASEEEHDDEDDDEDKDEEEEGGAGVGSDGCSPWGLIDAGGRGTSASGGPSMSPVDEHKSQDLDSLEFELNRFCASCSETLTAHLAGTQGAAWRDNSSSSQQHPTGSQT